MQCVISCIIGNRFKTVFPAPLADHSYFFTNNKEIFGQIKKKGWTPIFYDIPIKNIWHSSMDSKYIKFLQFLKDDQFKEILGQYKDFVYVDHKLYLKKEHIDKVNKIKNKSILVTRTPIFKDKVMTEYSLAIKQERYAKTASEMLSYIRGKINQGYSESSRICRTGLIFYNLDDDKVLELATKVYQDVIEIPNPQCQIIWAIISQKYKDIIQEIEWSEVKLIWAYPPK